MPHFCGNDGSPIDSEFEIERNRDKLDITVKAGGGTVNREYNLGMERFLGILSLHRISIDKIELDSSVAKKAVSVAERELPFTYPLKPWESTPVELRRKIGRTAKSIAQQEGAKGGGNTQRKIKFKVADFQPGKSLEKISQFISGCRQGNESHDEIPPLPPGLDVEGETIFTRSNNPAGWLYIITSPKWPGWVKIGITRNLRSRLSTYNTGVPLARDYFDYEHYLFHPHARDLEKKIHFYLKSDKRKGDSSEWYEMSISNARELISKYSEEGLE